MNHRIMCAAVKDQKCIRSAKIGRTKGTTRGKNLHYQLYKDRPLQGIALTHVSPSVSPPTVFRLDALILWTGAS